MKSGDGLTPLLKAAIATSLVLAAVVVPAPAARADDPPAWTAPIEPFRIGGNLYYVGTQGLAAYLLVSSQGAILLDGTLPANAAQIEANIRRVGVALDQVKLLVSNHAHDDHVGALAQLKRDTGARLAASAGDRWALEHGESRGDTTYGIRRFPPVQVDRIVGDGQVVRVGDVALTAHLTPGHTPGCTSWSTTIDDGGAARRVLFLCSLTVAGNVLIGNRAHPAIVDDFRATFAKVAAMQADIVLTGHPEMADVLQRQARHAAGDANAFVDPGLLPKLVDDFRSDFDEALSQAQAAKPPAAD